ncbi:MAG: MoaD/ThiS family protein [Candidatus Ranarchaeia archaeon]
MTITITIKTMGSWASRMRFRKMEIQIPENTSVKTLLEILSEKIHNFRETVMKIDGDLKIWQRFLINGRSIRYLNRLETIIKENDVVAIFPAVAGG